LLDAGELARLVALLAAGSESTHEITIEPIPKT